MNTMISHKNINEGGAALALAEQSIMQLVSKSFCPTCGSTLVLETHHKAITVDITITCKACGYSGHSTHHAVHSLEDKHRLQQLPYDSILVTVDENHKGHVKNLANMLCCACLEPLRIFISIGCCIRYLTIKRGSTRV